MPELSKNVQNLILIFDEAIKELFSQMDNFENIASFSQWFRKKFSQTKSGVFLALINEEKILYFVNEDQKLNINNPLSPEKSINDSLLLSNELKKHLPNTARIFPIQNETKVYGFLYTKNFEKHNDLLNQKFDFLAQQIAFFLNKQENKYSKQYIEGLESKVKTLTGLNEFSLLISSIIYKMDKETLTNVVTFCGKNFESTHCALIILSDQKEEAEIVAGWQSNNVNISWIGLKYGIDSPLGIVMNEALYNKKVVSLSDILIDNNMINSLGEFSEIFDLKTTVLIPLFKLDNFFGFLVFRNFLHSFEELGRTVANILSGALLNAKLYKNNIEIKYYLSNLIKSSRDAIISLDLSGKIILWNQGAQNIFGYKEEEIIGKNFYYLFSSESRIKVTGEWIEILTGRVIMGEEGIGLKKGEDKISISYTLSPINDKSNNIIGVSIIFRDLTERKKLEYDISESKNKLQAIFDSLSDHIVLFDLEHKILMANKIAINFTGLAPRELIGQKKYLLIDNILLEGKTPIEVTIKTKKSFLADEFIYDNKVYNIKTFPVFDSIRNLTSIILHARDLTKEKSLYNQAIE